MSNLFNTIASKIETQDTDDLEKGIQLAGVKVLKELSSLYTAFVKTGTSEVNFRLNEELPVIFSQRMKERTQRGLREDLEHEIEILRLQRQLSQEKDLLERRRIEETREQRYKAIKEAKALLKTVDEDEDIITVA